MKKYRTVFIGGITGNISTKDIDIYFRQFGKIKNIIFKKDKTSEERRTFAYLVFQDQISAEAALFVDKHMIKGKRIDCQSSHGGKDKNRDIRLMIDTKLHLKGLTCRITSEDLTNYFSQYGEVRQAYVVIDSDNKKSKCFGFVQFYDGSITNKVLAQQHYLFDKKIKCKRFLPKMMNRLGNQNSSHKNSYEEDEFDDDNIHGDQQIMSLSEKGKNPNGSHKISTKPQKPSKMNELRPIIIDS